MYKILSVLWLMLAIGPVHAAPSAMQLPTGLWEGIQPDDSSYQLLEINSKPPHRLISLRIADGFRHAFSYTFDDTHVACTDTECAISLVDPRRPDAQQRLIIAARLQGSLNVMQMHVSASGQAKMATSYSMDRQGSQSTVKRFLQQHQTRLKALTPANSNDISGFWLGIVTINNKPELLQLEFSTTGQSTLTYYPNGMQITNQTQFSPNQIEAKNGSLFIKTSHPTFASELIVHNSNNNLLSGYLYSVHKTQVLQAGSFVLYRIGQ